ncbi:hypothetical protein GCM10020256_12360 [Streptomyces thermocoprophilus]
MRRYSGMVGPFGGAAVEAVRGLLLSGAAVRGARGGAAGAVGAVGAGSPVPVQPSAGRSNQRWTWPVPMEFSYSPYWRALAVHACSPSAPAIIR